VTLARDRQQATGKITIGDYDYVIPIIFSSTVSNTTGVGEFYDHSLGISNTVEATPRVANLRLDESVAASLPLTGTANMPGLRVGTKLQVNDTTGGTFGGTYVVTGVEHTAMVAGPPGMPATYYAN